MRRMAVMWGRWSRAVDGGEVGERMGGRRQQLPPECPPCARHRATFSPCFVSSNSRHPDGKVLITAVFLEYPVRAKEKHIKQDPGIFSLSRGSFFTSQLAGFQVFTAKGLAEPQEPKGLLGPETCLGTLARALSPTRSLPGLAKNTK